jgi:hypothetical protein
MHLPRGYLQDRTEPTTEMKTKNKRSGGGPGLVRSRGGGVSSFRKEAQVLEKVQLFGINRMSLT